MKIFYKVQYQNKLDFSEYGKLDKNWHYWDEDNPVQWKNSIEEARQLIAMEGTNSDLTNFRIVKFTEEVVETII